MSGYALTYKRKALPHLNDGAFVRPDVLGKLDRQALGAKQVRVGAQQYTLSNWFAIKGSPGDTLTVRSAPPLSRLGAGMCCGKLIVEGDAGDDLGASMCGGVIVVSGSTGRGAGGPNHLSDRGMTGGEIIIHGDAGDEVGLRQRGGMIGIAGGAGRSPGYRMLAGTIVIGRGPLDYPGLEMHRGSILCLDRNTQLKPGLAFAHDGVFEHVAVMSLIIRRLRQLGMAVQAGAEAGRFALYCGDRFELNKGELWQWRY